MSGMTPETATVIDWVCNDRPVHMRLVEIIQGADMYRGRRATAAVGSKSPATVRTAAVGDFIEHLLTRDDGSTYRNLYRVAREMDPTAGGGFESWFPGSVAAEIGRDAWTTDAIDWSAVRDAVMRGEDDN